MKGPSTLVITLLAAALRVSAFTNGTLVPAYICNPANDGMPKSFGQLLTYTRLNLTAVAFNADAGLNLNTVPTFTPTPPSKIMNSAYNLASFHNSLNTVQAIDPGLQIMSMNGGPIVAGLPNQLNISTFDPNKALDGVLIYAMNAAGQRVGSFSDVGSPKVFVDFPGCGLSMQGQMAGVIQEMVITCNSFYTGLVFNAPIDLQGNVTFKGLSVTDAGFGVFTLSKSVVPCNLGQTMTIVPPVNTPPT